MMHWPMSSATVVILMAISKLEEIMDIFAGFRKTETPVAIIREGTTPNVEMVTGTVRDLIFHVRYPSLSSPAVIVVGEVVKLHPHFKKEIMVIQSAGAERA